MTDETPEPIDTMEEIQSAIDFERDPAKWGREHLKDERDELDGGDPR